MLEGCIFAFCVRACVHHPSIDRCVRVSLWLSVFFLRFFAFFAFFWKGMVVAGVLAVFWDG